MKVKSKWKRKALNPMKMERWRGCGGCWSTYQARGVLIRLLDLGLGKGRVKGRESEIDEGSDEEGMDEIDESLGWMSWGGSDGALDEVWWWFEILVWRSKWVDWIEVDDMFECCWWCGSWWLIGLGWLKFIKGWIFLEPSKGDGNPLEALTGLGHAVIKVAACGVIMDRYQALKVKVYSR